MLRHHLGRVATIVAIVDLPSVAFAQAGTRTKTAVLYLRKRASPAATAEPVFMGVAHDLGFQVASRKGVQVKVASGRNEMPDLAAAYKKADPLASVTLPKVLRTEPSAVLISAESLASGSWTPNHHHAKRYSAVAGLRDHEAFELKPLGQLVQFVGDSRRKEPYRVGTRFISVLHILGEGLFDIDAIYHYAPRTAGIPVNPGEVLLSRINPRIPRVCVVPDLDAPILCSSEFEVMVPLNGLDPFALAYLLQTRVVQEQITSLTSGTSASHNRVKTVDLAKATVPIPRTGSDRHAALVVIGRDYRKAVDLVTANAIRLRELRAGEATLIM
jgi:hypothetical protein